jgi:hypothetical protein
MQREVKEPWLSFLREVDEALTEPVDVHCLGGFVLGVLWDLPRPTGDIDFIEVRPGRASEKLLGVAGQGSALADKYHLNFQRVAIAIVPDDYESRLTDITPPGLQSLRLKALEAHDIVLAKVSRNSPRDRADVEFLAGRGVLDPGTLKTRFETGGSIKRCVNELRRQPPQSRPLL